MASLSRYRGGTEANPRTLWRVQFAEPGNGTRGRRRRRTLYLGAEIRTRRAAEQWLRAVDDLVEARAAGKAPARAVSEWLAEIGDEGRAKLEAVGLVDARPRSTLGEFIDRYIADRGTDTKPGTRIAYGRGREHLVEFFGEACPLSAIAPADADRWRRWLTAPPADRMPRGLGGKGPEIRGRGLADNTARRSVGFAKQWLKAAMRARIVEANPFAELSAVVQANPSRMAYIDRATAERVLEACPDAEWRLLFALARFGGLRVPSEALGLRWSDIDWAGGRFTVRSPKTEHHEGKASRVVPLFPELLPYLREAYELAPPGSVHCLRMHFGERSSIPNGTIANLRTQLGRIIAKAQVKPWPKLWQNLRSTRETELADEFPAHVVVAWLGNSEAVARKHYLQVTDEHFATAAGGERAHRAAHGAAHQVAQKRSEGLGDERKRPRRPLRLVSEANALRRKTTAPSGRSGRESSGPYWNRTPRRNSGESGHSSRAQRTAQRTECAALPAELRGLVDRWADLPDPIRAGIVAMIEAALASSR